MRVLFLTDNPNLGSTARILQSWLPLAPRHNVDCAVVAPPGSQLLPWLSRNGIPHLADPQPWPNRRWPVPSLWHAWRVARWGRRQGIGIVHCNEHNVYPFGALVAKLSGLPIVCHVRCKLDSGFGTWAFGRRCPDALLWSTEAMRHESGAVIAGIVPEQRQHVIPLGLDLSHFGLMADRRQAIRDGWGVRDDQVVVGMASAFRPGKRIEDFIAIARELSGQHPEAFFVLAGDVIHRTEEQPYHEFVRPLIQDAEKTLPFRWIGNQEPVEPVLHAMDVYVSTSEHESFGMSVCEAMACSRAVAGYAACSVEEVIGDAGLVVPTKDVDGLAAAVSTLIGNSSLRAKLGEQARRRVIEKFNPADSLTQLIGIYKSILRTSKSAGSREPGESQCPMTQTLHS